METNLVVGAGQAGAWAAVAMRKAGFAGRILLVGDEPWCPYERPPLSKQVLAAPEEPPVLYFHEEARYAELGIELLLGTAVAAIEPAAQRVRLADRRRLPYDRLLLATGGRARRLAVPGGDAVLYLRTLDDARRIRRALEAARRVACIGAGVIGLEIASSARARGCEVTVVEAAGAPMGRCVSPEGAAFVADLHRRAGVALYFGAAVEAIVPDPSGAQRVICAGGPEIVADCVVAGVGMERNVALAAEAGLALDGGIVVDECGASSIPGIYAAGDVAAFAHPLLGRLRLESWQHAQNHGTAVGRAMAGQPSPYADIPWFWTDQHGVNIQVAGLPALAARTVTRPGPSPAQLALFHLAADGRVVAATGIDSPREVRAAQSLIRSARPVDPATLADPAVPLQRIVAAVR